ncbi:MAG: hypothetical protein QOD82_5978 [Pseudonocardiales bacterium]|nr:hypothetical protein [Pseudonocardiales bacterium]MDT7678076.1 hypothetical protein [Pseudonocardiales bacterium]
MLGAPFRGTEALAAGLLTRARLYGPRYRRVYPDVYLPADRELDLATRSRAAYLLVRDRGGVLAGYAAAAVLGVDCAPDDAPAEVLLATNSRPHPGLLIHRGTATGADLTVVGDLRVTSPLRTAWDLARRLPLVEAVVVVDALAGGVRGGVGGVAGGDPAAGTGAVTGGGAVAGGFAPAELLARRAAEPGARGSRRLVEAVALADPRAESPPETRLRVALVRAGLPRPEVQFPVLDEYGFELARADLAYPAAKLAIEYDGSTHFEPSRARRDRERDGELAGIGWQTLRVVADDVGIGMLQTTQRVARLLELRT